MGTFAVIIHALVCILMVVIILMQSGRGGGLTENFASAESLFGAKTSAMLIKATTVIATIFLVTCLGLAVISSKKGKSLMPSKIAPQAPLESTSPIDELFEEEAGGLAEETFEEIVEEVTDVTTEAPEEVTEELVQ